MKQIRLKSSILIIWTLSVSLACNNSNTKDDTGKAKPQQLQKRITKPPATYQDTLVINFPAAVFYHPDSFQLQKIKTQTDPGVFDGTMHEFFYQMRNARMVIKHTWPGLKIKEAKNCRYLVFIAAGKSMQCIDLDKNNDAYGLLIFNQKKPPLTIDMMNIETEVSFYMKE